MAPNPYVIPFSWTGVPIQVDRHLCQKDFLRWKRLHRKRRIHKKWMKKYGGVAVLRCKGYVYRIVVPWFDGIAVCPCFKKELDKYTDQI